MKLFFLLMLFAFLSSCVHENQFDEFDEMCGNWLTIADSNGFFSEKWIIEEEVMHGQGFYIKEKDTLFKEKLKIKKVEGKLTYTATLPDGSETNFVLKSKKDNYWRFENPEHDFPKIIEYQLSNKKCKIFLNGIENSKQRCDTLILFKQK